MNLPAARLDDPMTHSGALIGNQVGTAIGLSIGIVVGLLTIPLTGPAAVCAVIVLANEGAQLGVDIGGWAGEKVLPTMELGKITEAAESVFIGRDRRRQARIEDDVKCSGGQVEMMTAAALALVGGALGGIAASITELSGGGHGGARIAQGCMTISVERMSAARKGCRTTCGGTISAGDETVWLGKELGALPGYQVNDDISETPGLSNTLAGLDWVSTAVALVGAFIEAAPVGIGVAILGGVSKLVEWGTGTKPVGYGDDAGGALEVVIEELTKAGKEKGLARKLIAVGISLAKGGKRTGKLGEKEALPLIGQTKP